MPRRKKAGSLQLLFFLMLGATIAVFAVVFFAVFHASMPGMLLQAENKYLSQQVRIVERMLATAKERTLTMADDTAIWDETVAFAEGKNPGFIEKNWPDTSPLQTYKFNFLIITDKNAADLHVEFYDFNLKKTLSVPAGFSDFVRGTALKVIKQHQTRQDYSDLPLEQWGAWGVVFFEGVPYSLACMPIMHSHDAVEPAGVLMLGNILSDEYFRNVTGYDIGSFVLLSAVSSGELGEYVIRRENEYLVSTSLSLRDIDGNPITLLINDMRTIYMEGRQILDNATLVLLGVMIVFAAALYQIVLRLVLRPVGRLSRDVAEAASSGGIMVEKYSGSREFVTLCAAVNDMIQGLNLSQSSIDVLRHILNGMDAFLYVSDPQTDKILFINDKMQEHYGIRDEGVGQICWQVLQLNQTGRCSFCPNHAFEKNPDATVSWDVCSALTGRWYHNTDCLINWPDGRRVHLQHSLDITDAKNTEAALKKRLEQQELMAIMARNFISSADTDSFINDALRMTGNFMNLHRVCLSRLNEARDGITVEYAWSNESRTPPLVGRRFPLSPDGPVHTQLIAGKASCAFCDDTRAAPHLAGGITEGTAAFILAPVYVDGTLWGVMCFAEEQRPYSWSASDKHLVTLIGSVISGVVERGVTVEKLERMSSIVNSSPQYIAYTDMEGSFEYFNRGVLDITGYSAEELKAGGMDLFLDEETRRRVRNEIAPRILKEGKAEFELPLKSRDGRAHIMSFSAFMTDFTELGIGAIASDITEKRQLEKDLLAAKEQAEQSSRAKSEFLSRMSHEMRTPLNAIIGMTNIAQSSGEQARMEYCLEKIDGASKHLLGVINDILDMSKIEAGKFELSFTDFCVEKLLMRVINVINFRLEEKAQKLTVHTAPDMPYAVVGDEQRIAQVIANLLSNAVKFTPEGGSVTLSACRIDEQDGLCTLRIDVKDTGIGIPKEQQDKLFHSFEQADGGIARKFGGTGLGLAISKNIVEMMGGAVWVESAAGEGATFSFTMKVRRSERLRPSPSGPVDGRQTPRVLVVDDAPEVREYFAELADNAGFFCETAADGLAALRLLETAGQAFHLVFVDWKMPGMDGVDLTRRIKQTSGADAVVVMISATQWSDIEKEAVAAGVSRFLPKPLFSSLVVDCINECTASGQRSAPGQHRRQAEENSFSGYRVLLAEDNEVNREIVLSLLEHTGLGIDCAENGRQAIDMFQEAPSRYAVIFMDIHMPEMDGYEATQRIRALEMPEARSIPIVAMTANVFREDIAHCLAAGMTDHIGKPLNIDELMEKLRKYL